MVDGTGATRIYLDGISRTVTVGAGSDTGDFIAAGADRFRIGDLNDTSSEVNFLGGQIDDVRIYNRALSKEEIKRLYTMGCMNH